MQTQCAAATEARKRTGSSEIDPTRSKKPCHLWKQLDDQRCGDDRFVIYIYFFSCIFLSYLALMRKRSNISKSEGTTLFELWV